VNRRKWWRGERMQGWVVVAIVDVDRLLTHNYALHAVLLLEKILLCEMKEYGVFYE